MYLAGFTANWCVGDGMARMVPLQTVEIEPTPRVLEWAEQSYEETDPDKDREEYIREMVLDSVMFEVDLDGVELEP